MADGTETVRWSAHSPLTKAKAELDELRIGLVGTHAEMTKRMRSLLEVVDDAREQIARIERAARAA